jgi:hypothetical protein
MHVFTALLRSRSRKVVNPFGGAVADSDFAVKKKKKIYKMAQN